MHIEINDNVTLRSIQDVFSDYYPYLQIEFYKKPHKIYEASKESDLIFPGKTIGEVKKNHVSGLLEINPLNTIADIESEFKLRFGLSVQVLRKENDKFIQTTGMDDFSLKELNELARNSSDEYITAEPDFDIRDYEL